MRTAEVGATLCLATDLGMGFPLEHGLRSTLLAMGPCDRLGVDDDTRSATYYGCLLIYVGSTADAEVAADVFERAQWSPTSTRSCNGSRAETMTGILRALGGTSGAAPARVLRAVRTLPRALAGHRRHIDALCEVGEMLSERLGMPSAVQGLFAYQTERWDGKAYAGRSRGDHRPLRDYRNAGQLQSGGVLVVGAGNSGAEIALEVVPTHKTWLAGRDTGHVPFDIHSHAARLVLNHIVLGLPSGDNNGHTHRAKGACQAQPGWPAPGSNQTGDSRRPASGQRDLVHRVPPRASPGSICRS